MTGGWQIAQINVGRLVAPAEDPQVADFMNALGAVNAMAEAAPGFVWRLQDEAGEGATDIRPAPDPRFIVNMSVWTDADSLFHFVYRSAHTPFMVRRREWFDRFEGAHQALWWIAAGHRPTVEEGLSASGCSTATARVPRPSPSRPAFPRRTRWARRSTWGPIRGASAGREYRRSGRVRLSRTRWRRASSKHGLHGHRVRHALRLRSGRT